MVPAPPTPSAVRSGWRAALLAFGFTAFVAIGFTLAPLLGPMRSHPKPSTDAPGGDSFTATTPTRWGLTAWYVAHTPAFSSDLDVVFRCAATNLSLASGPTQLLAAATNDLPVLRGVADNNAAASVTNRSTRAARELPVFTALRASANQPIPKEISDLARDLTRDCKTDTERARVLYDWITGHITYDWKVWADIVAGANTYTQPQDPLSVLQRGTAVCAGYAWLFDAFATSVGLDATFVIGNVRGYRGTADDNLVSPYLHAWNSVQLDGQWYLLDSTWGARQDGESATDYLARRDYYFLTPANQMIFDHWPENPTAQLLSSPVNREAFQNLPNLKPTFFRTGLLLGNAFSDVIATPVGTPTGVAVAVPSGILIAATLSSHGQDLSVNNLFLRQNSLRTDVVVGPLPAGTYILRLYAKPATYPGPYECAADYAVTVGGP